VEQSAQESEAICTRLSEDILNRVQTNNRKTEEDIKAIEGRLRKDVEASAVMIATFRVGILDFCSFFANAEASVFRYPRSHTAPPAFPLYLLALWLFYLVSQEGMRKEFGEREARMVVFMDEADQRVKALSSELHGLRKSSRKSKETKSLVHHHKYDETSPPPPPAAVEAPVSVDKILSSHAFKSVIKENVKSVKDQLASDVQKKLASLKETVDKRIG